MIRDSTVTKLNYNTVLLENLAKLNPDYMTIDKDTPHNPFPICNNIGQNS